jgi:hypothetical protein
LAVKLPLTGIASLAVAAEKDRGERHAIDFGKRRPRRAFGLHLMSDEARRCGRGRRGPLSN